MITAQRKHFALSGLLAAITLGPLVLFGLVSVILFENGLTPLYYQQTEVAAQDVERRLEHSIQMFGDIDAIRDVDSVLDQVRRNNPDIDVIAVANSENQIFGLSFDDDATVQNIERLFNNIDPDSTEQGSSRFFPAIDRFFQTFFGAPLFSPIPETTKRIRRYVVTWLPIDQNGQQVGTVYAVVDVGLFERVRYEVALDAITIILAAILIGSEFMRMIFAVHVKRPKAIIQFQSERLEKRDLRFLPLIDSGGSIATLAKVVNARVTNFARRVAVQGQRTVERAGRVFTLGPNTKPLAVNLPAVDYIRLPLFLFFLAEVMLRPFLPLYLESFSPTGLIPPELQVGVGMSAFMAMSIPGIYYGAILCERLSVKNVFLISVAVAALSMFAHALAVTSWQAIAARACSGLSYGLVYAAAQMYISQHATGDRQSSGYSLFLAVIATAEISGVAIGGILAERVGYELTFVLSSLLLALSVLTAFRGLPADKPDTDLLAKALNAPGLGVAPQAPEETSGKGKSIFRNIRFVVLFLCFAIPAKVLLNGALYLLVPLAVIETGATTADAGRVIMLYGVAVFLGTSWLAGIADKRNWSAQWVYLGGLLAGVGLSAVAFLPTLSGLAFAVVLLGIGQAMSIPSQLTLAVRVAAPQVRSGSLGRVTGLYRFFERFGSFLGALFAAALLTVASPFQALALLGVYGFFASCAGVVFFLCAGIDE